jgi:hypothetical protein
VDGHFILNLSFFISLFGELSPVKKKSLLVGRNDNGLLALQDIVIDRDTDKKHTLVTKCSACWFSRTYLSWLDTNKKSVLVTYVKWWTIEFSPYSSVTSLTSNIHSLLPRRLYNAPRDTFRHRQIHSPRLVSLASLHSSLCSCSFEVPYHLLGHPAPRVCQHVYKIHVIYIQTKQHPLYSIVEKTNFR